MYVHARHVYAKASNGVNFNAITIAFDEGEMRKFKCSNQVMFYFKAEVKFELKHSYFQHLHVAINRLPQHVVRRLNPTLEQLSFPREEKRHYFRSPEPPYDCLQLDQVQMKALHVTLNSSPDFPILVAGPFGTGKTRLLARAAYDILGKRRSRVLICAHHHVSVDTFMNYFGAMKRDEDNPWPIGMVRVLPDGHYQSATKSKYEDFFVNISDLSERVLENSRLIITTLGTAPKLFNKIQNRRVFFSDILIDEGAQTREPETVAPLSLAGENTRIIIAGDHCQV